MNDGRRENLQMSTQGLLSVLSVGQWGQKLSGGGVGFGGAGSCDEVGYAGAWQGWGAMAVSAGHFFVGYQGVEHRLFCGLDDGLVERVEVAPWDEAELVVVTGVVLGLVGVVGLAGVPFAGIAGGEGAGVCGGEGEEQVAGIVGADGSG